MATTVVTVSGGTPVLSIPPPSAPLAATGDTCLRGHQQGACWRAHANQGYPGPQPGSRAYPLQDSPSTRCSIILQPGCAMGRGAFLGTSAVVRPCSGLS